MTDGVFLIFIQYTGEHTICICLVNIIFEMPVCISSYDVCLRILLLLLVVAVVAVE